MIRFLRNLYRFLFESGVDFDGHRMPHGAQVGHNGELYAVFAPPLARLDRWLWLLWERRIRRSGATGAMSITFTINGSQRYVNVTRSGVKLPHVPSVDAVHVPDPASPAIVREHEERARRRFAEKQPRIGRHDLN